MKPIFQKKVSFNFYESKFSVKISIKIEVDSTKCAHRKKIYYILKKDFPASKPQKVARQSGFLM